MVFIFECCGTKVNQADLGVEEDSALRSVSVDGRRRRWDFAIICECLVALALEQDVFGLQVGVNQVKIM